jgi:predicted regulator of Ras-like GTPase activity (Roadblock/LC7/MglB family)
LRTGRLAGKVEFFDLNELIERLMKKEATLKRIRIVSKDGLIIIYTLELST